MGRTAVISGAASGIGRALALRAAREGMAVAACDRDAAGLDALRANLGDTPCVTEALDVTDPQALARFAASAQALPPTVLLFANAGLLRSGPILTMPLTEWRMLADVNLIGVVATLQAFAPTMIAHGEQARIVVTGSTGSMVTASDLTAYCATKHALWPIVEALQEELSDSAVGASLLIPGAVATHIFDTIDSSRAAPPDSITPDAAADMAFAGAIAGLPKILTHPSYIGRARARFARVIEELGAR